MLFFGWILEVICWNLNLFSNLFTFINLDKTSNKFNKSIVIVVGGFTGPVLYVPLKTYLQKKGFDVYIPHFSHHMDNLETACTELESYMDERQIENTVLVGISAGGLVSYMYLHKHNGWKKVNKFITIGTPFKGTYAALLTLRSIAGKQLLPNSEYIKKINGIKPQNTSRIYNIYAEKDELVPKESSFIEKANRLEIPVIGHVMLHSFSTKTFSKIAEIANY